MLQTLRSLVFNAQMYVAMLVIGVVFFPWALVSRQGAEAACHAYCRWVFWTLGWMVGLRVEVRGTPPKAEALVASKHQSFLDVMAVYHPLPHGFFIMKKILMYAPVIGQYGLRVGCVPVHRGKRGAAIRKMLEDVEAGKTKGGPLIIYPQGTRVAPGAYKPYKGGTAALYEQMGQPCYPVATNIGVFWPKRGVTRKPGLAVVEFLDPIASGMDKEAFLQTLEDRIETASNRLMKEAGFDPDRDHRGS